MNNFLDKRRLLIVEDDSDIRLLLSHFFQEYVDEIVLAENGAEALVHVKNQEFDSILCDIEMPKMNGLKFLAYLRSLGQMTPFVVLTAFGDHNKALDALYLGAFDFIPKDAKKAQMIQSVCTALNLGSLLKASINNPEQSKLLLQTYKDMARDSEIRLKKIIDGMKTTG
jgi:DNA-binding NtrC family response regulator